MEDTLAKCGDKKVGLIRLDSGFFQQDILQYLEEKKLNYIVAAKFNQPIQRFIHNQKGWIAIDDGIEICEQQYKASSWDAERPMVIIRQKIKERPQATGRTLRLFADDEIHRNYRYSAYITNLEFSCAEVWRLYRGRGDAENRIKELKYDFGFDSFNLKDFYATEAALTFVMIAYNLMSIFRMFVLQEKTQKTLTTLRYRVFAIGASFEDLSEIIVQNIRRITGFDRVMVYRFDTDGCGHVIAEDKRENLNSFYGLRYPATDVPEPARRLYKLNYIRMIPHVDYQWVHLPNHPVSDEPFDLSFCNLRSVSPMHVEYLKNMGVKASMSISLLKDNELWGLVACHHYQPKYIPYEIRAACEFLGKVMSLHLVAKAEQEDLIYQMNLKDRLSKLFENLSQIVDVADGLEENLTSLQCLVDSGGVALCFPVTILLSQTPDFPSPKASLHKLRTPR